MSAILTTYRGRLTAALHPQRAVDHTVLTCFRFADKLRGQVVAFFLGHGDPLARKLGILGCCIAATVILSGCDPYNMVRDIRIENPPGLPSFQAPPPLDIINVNTDPAPINLGARDQCNDSNWFVSWAMQIIAGAVSRFMYEIMTDSYKVFGVVINVTAARTPYEDPIVLYIWNILVQIAEAIIPLSVVWAGIKMSVGGPLQLNYLAAAKAIPRAIIAYVLLWPLGDEGIGALAYLLTIPVTLCNKLFELFAKIALGATDALHNFAGIFSGTLACQILGVLIIAVFGAIIAAMLILLTVAFVVRVIVIDIYFLLFVLLVAVWPFEELSDYMPRFTSGYIQTAVAVVPIGIILMLLAAFLVPASGDNAVIMTAVNMLLATICLFAAMKVTDRMMQGGISSGVRAIRQSVGRAAGVAVGGAVGAGAAAAAHGGKFLGRGAGIAMQAARGLNDFAGQTTRSRWTPDDGWQETSIGPRERLRRVAQASFAPTPRPATSPVAAVGAYRAMPSGVEEHNRLVQAQAVDRR